MSASKVEFSIVIAVDTLHIGNRAVDRRDVPSQPSFSRHIVIAVLVPPPSGPAMPNANAFAESLW
jgi:hypothetical protein